jgi:hypothetical protein
LNNFQGAGLQKKAETVEVTSGDMFGTRQQLKNNYPQSHVRVIYQSRFVILVICEG